MRTIRTKVYKFNELNEEAKKHAINKNRTIDAEGLEYLYDEAHDSVKKFHDIFGTKEGSRSWLDVNTGQIDDNILEMSGIRLYKYIWNNFKNYLLSGEYYSTNGYLETQNKYHYKSRKSKINLTHDCELTGVCWDESLLKPIYDFLEWGKDYSNTDFDTLISDCFHELKKALDAEEEYRKSDEFIAQELEDTECEFTKDGNLFG
ncbi:MAG TPA: hypothetical protein VFM99_07660 [Chitinophagales bacterium]|nr:hypothetical protein [Chitinophagales bacterium]